MDERVTMMMTVMMEVAHVRFWGRAPPRRLAVPDRVWRTGPLTAPSLLRPLRRREEQGRIRESHKEAVTFMYDRPEEGDSTRRVVAYFNRLSYNMRAGIRRA